MRLAFLVQAEGVSLSLNKGFAPAGRFSLGVQGGQVFVRNPQRSGLRSHFDLDTVAQVALADGRFAFATGSHRLRLAIDGLDRQIRQI